MATLQKFVFDCTHPDSFSCPKCRPPSMLPDDVLGLTAIMKGNKPRGGINVVSFANWSYKPKGAR